MLATFAFDVCHDVYVAAREAIDTRVATINLDASGKYQWRPDRMPRLAEYVCDFARAGERALEGRAGGRRGNLRFEISDLRLESAELRDENADSRRGVVVRAEGKRTVAEQAAENVGSERVLEAQASACEGLNYACGGRKVKRAQAEACATGSASRMAMFRVFYLGGAEYVAARRHLGIGEITWADWAEEIRRVVGRELVRSRVFPPSKYFREMAVRES
jgi:regulator of protease activity HflC (stomatin/prohibitin superfamily)